MTLRIFFWHHCLLCDEPSARPTLYPVRRWSGSVQSRCLLERLRSLVADLALRRFVRFVTRTIDFDEQLDEVTFDSGADFQSFDWDQVHQAVDINHDTWLQSALCGGCAFETPHVARDASSLVVAGLRGPLLKGRAEQQILGLHVTSTMRGWGPPSQFRPAWLLEGWVRRDLRAEVLTSAQGYKRCPLCWEVEAFLGFEHGVSACMLEPTKSTAIPLEVVEEMRTKRCSRSGTAKHSKLCSRGSLDSLTRALWWHRRPRLNLLGSAYLSSLCIPRCPLQTSSRGSAMAGGAAAGFPAALHALPNAVLTDPVLPLDLQFAVALSAGSLDVPLKKLRRCGVLSYVSSSVPKVLWLRTFSPYSIRSQVWRAIAPARCSTCSCCCGNWVARQDVSLSLSARACLVGDIEESHIFHSALHASSRESVQALLRRCPPAIIWKKTCDEVAVGYMTGPSTAADFDNLWCDPDRPFHHRAEGFFLEGHRYNRIFHHLEGPPLTIQQGVAYENGPEVWKLLNKRYSPVTPMRGIQLMLVMHPGKILKGKDIKGCIYKWEGYTNMLERDYKEIIFNRMRIGTLARMMTYRTSPHSTQIGWSNTSKCGRRPSV